MSVFNSNLNGWDLGGGSFEHIKRVGSVVGTYNAINMKYRSFWIPLENDCGKGIIYLMRSHPTKVLILNEFINRIL